MRTFNDYVRACDYPGECDVAAVNTALSRYCAAIKVPRTVHVLPAQWWHTELFDVVIEIALDARAALDALDARDALAARAVRDALDEQCAILLREFGVWCIMRFGWWSWNLDWLATVAIGARQTKAATVSEWAEPVLDAFCAGAWFVIWTESTLFWVPKPVVSVETTPTGRRLHCETGPACTNVVQNLYFWHGVLVPAYAVVQPQAITLREIEAERNEELRRILIERFGWPRYIAETDAQCIDSRQNDVDGTTEALVRMKDGSQRLLCACRSTGRVYAIGVPRELTTCEQSQRFMREGGNESIRPRAVLGAS